MKAELDPFRRFVAGWKGKQHGCFVCRANEMRLSNLPPCERCTLIGLMIKDLENLIYQLDSPRP